MRQLRALLNKQSLRTRLIGWFLLIALVPLGWTAFISYEMCKKILFDQATKHLKSLILKQEELTHFYFQEKELDARDFIRDRTALEAVSELEKVLTLHGRNSPEFQETKQKFYSSLLFRMKALDYKNLFLVSKTGLILFSVLPFPTVGDNLLQFDHYMGLAKIFKKSRDLLKMDMVSLLLKPTREALNSFISIPLLDSYNELKGIAIVELDTSAMYRFLSSFHELEERSDLLLVAKLNETFYIIEAKTSPDEINSAQSVDPSSSFGQFIQQVLTEHHVIQTQVDYQGERALIVGRRFEKAFNWALIIKINERELLAPIYQFQYLFWILLITTTCAVILAASNVAKKIASPILTLTDKTKILAAGDLSQRIQVVSQDEIGRLGESFNEMAAQLDNLIKHLDYLVAKRTEEIENQNVKLEQTIEELKRTQNRLITQEKLASLGALTAGIAHEIKNPLNFVNNFSELSLQIEKEIKEHLNSIKQIFPEKEYQELIDLFDTLNLNIEKIYEHGKRADSIVYNMLQHSRGIPGERRLTNIHTVLEEYIALSYHGMRAQDPTFNAKIEKEFDPSVPPISVVPQEISRVFLNLLNNAYYSIHQKAKKQANDSSYQPTVRISTSYQQENLILKFWDNGMGIAPDVFSKLFTPFFTTKPPGEGTGLGLSLSYNIIVQGYQGTLNATTQLGEYAEFTITLPAKK